MIRKFILAFTVLSLFTEIQAQQGKLDITFNTIDNGINGDGFDKTVRTLSLQSDDKLIVGGEYLNLNGIPISYLTRLKPDGTIDDEFDLETGLNGKVYTSHIQTDGKIIVAGSFTSYNGNNSGRLIRLNQDGSQDTTFNTSPGATNGIIYKVCPQPDGKVIVVGSFTKYNNVTVNRIARILPNGALDTSFNTGSGAALNITDVAISSDNKILISGNFISFNGATTSKIARLLPDGSIDTSFNSGSGFNEDVNSMILQPNGKIILGGKFTDYNGISANRIIRLNEDATIDQSFLSGSGLNTDAVQVIKTDTFGNIMVGGSFKGLYNGSEVNRMFLLNSNGTLKPNFNTGSGPASASVFAFENAPDGSWYIGGSFLVFDGQNQGKLAKVDAQGQHDTSYLAAGVGFDNAVHKILSLEDRKTMVFGNFTKFNTLFAPRITRLLENGLSDETFNAVQSGANNLIKTAVLQSDGKIILGGNFTKYNDIISNRTVRILSDGAIDPTFNIGTGFKTQVYAIAMQDEKVIVAGNFTTYNDLPAGRIVRLLENGTRDPGFNAGLGADAIIETILVQSNGKILVGGRFNTFNGQSFSRLVRLNYDGSIDSDFNIGTGFDKFVYTIALQSDKKIIVGGTFLSYNGISQKRILRLNPDGSLDTTFDSGSGFSNGDVLTLLIQPDDRILVGGTFSGTYKTYPSLRLVRLMNSGDYDASFQADLNGKLNTMSFSSDHRLMIGGDFNSVSGLSKHRIARLKLCLESTIWNGISWSNGFPSGGKELTFNGDYPNLTSANACSCSIEIGKNITLLSSNTLSLEFDYSGSGTLILEDSASLYQSDDDMVNTGIVDIKRKSSPILKFDYTYWSSPVEGQKLIDVSPDTLWDKYFSFDYVSGNWKDENSSNIMTSGKGYIIRGPQDFSTTVPSQFEATFKGIPHNGKIDLDVGIDTYNLIGNPYPSAISADMFLFENKLNLKGALYFWTHNTPYNFTEYSSNDYAVYNLLGGVGTRSSVSAGVNETIPDGTIASGQAFFVASKNSGIAQFNNSMRIQNKNSSFFKPSKNTKPKNLNQIEKHRVWLNFENKQGVFKQILFGYIQGATNSYDEDYDAESFNGNQYVDFYSITDHKNLVIQGRALPFIDTDVIPLGYKTKIVGEFTISIDDIDGDISNQPIYIEDKTTGITHNLQSSNYTFTTIAGTFEDRFLIKYTDKTLRTKDFKNLENGILVSVKNKVINIKSSKENIKEVTVFDITGKLLYDKKKINSAELQIQNLPVNNQFLLVKVTLENDFMVTRKIVF
ncbi:T9SS sorting signal type C domain-containing protein [Flavobacterium psychroterrae]|uniref:T9SS sorting signal type C domain-containing protein n=1 Tax=Flavobacterium psychroterrae TaxID=2133767 RepID=UPI001FD05A2A|nr:T9SS sorting signal type C domain-containing protein [Flavobacterium psychroterrae]